MEVWVRKEYLTDHQSGHGEFVGRLGIGQIDSGRAFYFGLSTGICGNV